MTPSFPTRRPSDLMSGSMERPSVVLASFENPDGNRCVDIFVRDDGTFGFEEFRRDPEDCGVWTAVRHYSDGVYATRDGAVAAAAANVRSEEHTSELQSLMRISYAVFCLKKT